jgi:DNA-binding ferritin-like protein
MKGNSMNHDAMKNFLGVLMCGQVCLRLIHWNTTSYAEHKAIGKLYDGLADLTDTLAETYMGIYGRFGNIPCSHTDMQDGVSYVAEMADYIQSMRVDLPNDTQLQNIVDEIAATVDRTNYMLTLK